MKYQTVPTLLSGLAAMSLAVSPIALTAQEATAAIPAVPTAPAFDASFGCGQGVNKAIALVNELPITCTDLDHRVALLVAASRGQISPEEMVRVRTQVLRNLIDETLQIQAAKAQEIEVSQAEVDQTYARAAAEGGRTLPQMEAELRRIKSSPESLKRQILGELSWQRLLRRNIAPFVNVSAEEVNDMIARLEASRGTEEYQLGEIFRQITPETREQELANIAEIIEQLRQGGSFKAYARQYSQSSTAATGGDSGFVRLEMLPPELAVAARQMQVGQLVGPIENEGGFSILLLIDKRAVATADPRDATLSLKQISLKFPAGISEADAQSRLASFNTAVQQMNGCGGAEAGAAAIGADIAANDGIVVRTLPEQLQPVLLNMQVGQSTPPFGTAEEGVSVLMLCGRDDPQTAGLPSFDELMAQLEDDRVNKRAQSYLRDLRNDAVIVYSS